MTSIDDGALQFNVDDGDLFSGHIIMVRATLSKGLTDADIAG